MNCLEALNISPGVTSVIGSGGKTTLLRALASELHTAQPESHIILATTTHFMPFTGIEHYFGEDDEKLATLLKEHQVICVGTPTDPAASASKLGASPIAVEYLAQLADYVLVEADGSKRLPLKAHAEHEPVVPACSDQTILVLGASGFWHPISKVVHRPENFCKLTGAAPSDEATPALVGQAIAAEIVASKITPTKILINQMDTVSLLQTPEVPQLKAALTQAGIAAPVLAGTLGRHKIWYL